MVYFFNTNLNPKKKVFQAFTQLSGLGTHQALQICAELGLSSEKRLNQLTQLEMETLAEFLSQNYALGLDISRSMSENIQRLVKIGAYRGFRHTQGLPVRGQKTHGNSRTARKFKRVLDLGQK